MKIEEIDHLMRNSRMLKLTLSKLPTWVDEQRQEGIELKDGKYVSFWIKSGERIYNEPAGTHIEKIMQVLIDKTGKTSADGAEKEKEGKNELATSEKGEEEAIVGIVPETLTIPLLEKWKKMSTFDRMLMFQSTPKEKIQERKGFKRPDGTFEILKYVEGNYMLQEANIAFLFDWESHIENISIGATTVAVWGSVTVSLDGKRVSRAAVGVDEINSKVTAQHAIKNACTDMIKKGLASFGFNGDVYRGEV